MVFISAVEDAVFFGAFVSFKTLINEVLLDELLELLEEQHALSIGDGKRAEGVEARVLSVASALRLCRDRRH